MRIYLKQNVHDAAIERIRWLMSEFNNVIVTCSGGKDSTVIVNLVLSVAEQMNRLPLKVMFIDKEFEWQSLIEYQRRLLNDSRIEPLWFQAKIQVYNSHNHGHSVVCWDNENRGLMRDYECNSIRQNIDNAVDEKDFFKKAIRYFFGKEPACYISGVRCEESPSRNLGLTTYETYKGVTWGKVRSKSQYDFYPIYDWTFFDVWKYISEFNLDYTPIYDLMYQKGLPFNQMRLSSLLHSLSVVHIFYLHEVEFDTWNRMTQLIHGIHSTKQLREETVSPKELPFMFESWSEYRDHLLEHLIQNDEDRAAYRKRFEQFEPRYLPEAQHNLLRTEISTLLNHDLKFSKLASFEATHAKQLYNRGARSGRSKDVGEKKYRIYR